MTKLLSVLFLVSLCSSLALANIPDEHYCTVTPLLGDPAVPGNQVAFLAPGTINGTTLTITVRNASNNTIADAYVFVVFNNLAKSCVTALHSGTTNAAGRCIITLTGGGCLTAVTDACVIVANGVQIKSLSNVRSPDNGSHTASVPDGRVTLVDLGFFGDEFKGVAPAGCHDYDNNGICNVTDLGYFGTAFNANLVCDLAAR